MSNIIIAGPDLVINAATGAALSGGTWQSAFPLANLLKPSFATIARSSGVTTAATQFQIVLTTGWPYSAGIIAIPRHNLTSAAQVRFTGTDGGSASFDTGWLAVFPVGATGTLWPMPALYVPASPLSIYVVTVYLSDTSNPAGYVEIPRLFIAPVWQPSINPSYPAGITIEDGTVVQAAMGGAEYFDPRPKRRVARFTLGALPRQEMLTHAMDLTQTLGVSGQCFYAENPADTVNRQRTAFLARMRTLAALDSVAYGQGSQAFELSEIIA